MIWKLSLQYYAGGLDLGGQQATLFNTTISGNTAGYGGAIISYTRLTIRNSTIYDNESTDSDGVGGLIIANSQAEQTIYNSILAGNRDPRGNLDCAFGVLSASYALIQNPLTLVPGAQNASDCVVAFSPNNILGRAAQLGPLQNNGGETNTHALLAGSPALDGVLRVGPVLR